MNIIQRLRDRLRRHDDELDQMTGAAYWAAVAAQAAGREPDPDDDALVAAMLSLNKEPEDITLDAALLAELGQLEQTLAGRAELEAEAPKVARSVAQRRERAAKLRAEAAELERAAEAEERAHRIKRQAAEAAAVRIENVKRQLAARGHGQVRVAVATADDARKREARAADVRRQCAQLHEEIADLEARIRVHDDLDSELREAADDNGVGFLPRNVAELQAQVERRQRTIRELDEQLAQLEQEPAHA